MGRISFAIFAPAIFVLAGCSIPWGETITTLQTPYSQIDTSDEPGIQPVSDSETSPGVALTRNVPKVIGNPLDLGAWNEIFTAAFTAVLTLTGVWTAGKAKEKTKARRIAEIEAVVARNTSS